MLHVTTTEQILNLADQLGATIPKTVRAKWTKLTALRAKVGQLDLASDLPGAILTAVEKGNDIAADPGVQQAVVARAIGDVRGSVQAKLDAEVREFAIDHGHDALAGFKKPFDKAAATIARCLDSLGDVAIEDTAAILARGGNASEVWVEAQNADKVIADIQMAWKLLRTVAPVGLPETRYQLLIIADVPPAVFIDENLDKSRMRPWDVARRGWALSLADSTTILDRVNSIAEERQKRVARADGAFSEQYRKARGIAVVK